MDHHVRCFVSILVSVFISLMLLTTVNAQMAEPAHVYYGGSICEIGWQSEVEDGALYGNTDSTTRIEAITIRLSDTVGADSSIKYQTYVQDIGWTDEVRNGETAGTTGQDKQIEAIRIDLEGSVTQSYNVYYRVLAEDIGWLGWAKNGEDAGTIGISEAANAIQIQLAAKGAGAPGSTERPLMTSELLEDYSDVSYNANVEQIGWQKGFANGTEAGTTGESLSVEAMTVQFQDLSYGSNLNYSVHVDSDGWLNPVTNGQEAGTEGEGKAIQAMAINFTGPNEKMYDVYYQVHVQDIGWLDWAENGQAAGTTGGGKAIEAFRIVVEPKGDPAPGNLNQPYMELQPQPAESPSGWYWPLDGIYDISSGFGYRDGFGSSNHLGIDILAPAGTPIKAVRPGKVTIASENYYGYGNCVVIINDDTGEKVYYAHMSQIGTCAGAHVNAGDVIGYVGRTGTANANHLHLGVCQGGNWIDPTQFY